MADILQPAHPTSTAAPGGFRLPTGGAIDRSRPLGFRWDGRPLTAGWLVWVVVRPTTARRVTGPRVVSAARAGGASSGAAASTSGVASKGQNR